MKQISKIGSLAAIIAVLSACGGGGGDGGSPSTGGTATTSGGPGTTVTPAAPSFSQADMQQVASLGIHTDLLTDQWSGPVMNYLGAVASAFGWLANGDLVCESGTATPNMVKAGTYKGLHAGDQLTITYSQCTPQYSELTLDGTVTLTAISDIDQVALYGYDIKFEAKTSGLSVKNNLGQYQLSGTLDIETNSTVVESTDSFVVPAGNAFVATVNANSSTATVSYDVGTRFAVNAKTYGIAEHSATYTFDGSMSLSSNQSAAMPLTISIPTPMQLLVVAGSQGLIYTPLLGTINTTAGNPALATSTTLDAGNATISGDSDGNGSLDLVFSLASATLFSK
jgi:hypothetical protein